MGPEILDLAFSPEDEKVGFKCSLPEDYNDPYELFLSIDRTLDPQLLAFYQESIGEIPQIPPPASQTARLLCRCGPITHIRQEGLLLKLMKRNSRRILMKYLFATSVTRIPLMKALPLPYSEHSGLVNQDIPSSCIRR